MQFLKSLLRGLASSSFKLGLILVALLSAIVMVFGTSSTLKQALSNSKIYDDVIDTTLNAHTDDSNATESGLSLSAPQVKQAAQTAFSPSLVKSSTEQVIDSVYSWLEGKTVKPDFRLDFSAPKLQFATAAADNAAARARQLPACSPQQTRELTSSSDIDPYGIPCLPIGVSIDSIKNKVISDLANSEALVKTPVLTTDSLPKDSQGKTVFDHAAKAPQIFRWLLLAPWVLGAVTAFSGILLVVLYDDKRRALRAIAIMLLGCGVFLLTSTLLLMLVLKQVYKPNGPLAKLVTSNGLENNFLAVFRSLSSAFNNKLLVFGTIYAVIGAAILLFLYFNNRLRQVAASQNVETDEPVANELPVPTEDPASKSYPKDL